MKAITDVDKFTMDISRILDKLGKTDIDLQVLSELTCDIYCAIAEHTREIDRKGIE